MCLDSFYYFKDYQNLFEMRKMKDKKKYATRLDWGEIPGLYYTLCSYKTIDFCSYIMYNKDS